MEHKHKQAKTGKTKLEETNDFFEEVTNFEETTNLEESLFEPTGGFQKGFQQQYKKPNKMPDPIEIDVDGDQVAELRLTFSAIDAKQIRVDIEYIDTKQKDHFVFNYRGGNTNKFKIHHQDPSDGILPYRLYMTPIFDHTRVFYSDDDYKWELSKKQKKTGAQAKVLRDDLLIYFKQSKNKYYYEFIQKDEKGKRKTLKVFQIDDHKFKKRKSSQRGVVRDQTTKRDKKKQRHDHSVASYTIPVEVGGEKQNKYNFLLTIQKSPKDNGLAALSISSWAGTLLVPIPGEFAEVARAIATEKANHLELLFKGKKYNTILRIYYRQQTICDDKEATKNGADEIFELNVRSGAMPKNTRDVMSASKDYFGKWLARYKHKYVNGKYLPYHNANDNKTDKDEFHQKATKDARAKINAQPSSSSQEEELMNIRLRETQLIGAALKGKDFSDGHGKLISGDQVFMDYLHMVIAIYRLRHVIKAQNKTKDIEILAMLKNAQHKANVFWLGAYHIMKSVFPQYEDFQKPNKNKGKIMLDLPSHHQKPTGIISLKVHLKDLAKYIEAYDWESIDSAMRMFHTLLEAYAFRDKKKEVEKIYAEKAKKQAEKQAKGKKVTAEDIANARKENEREEASVIKGVQSNFNLDNRYHAFVKDKKPPAEVYRAKVMFYPEHLNVGENKKPTYIDVPLYYYKKDGYWNIISLVNKEAGKLFSAIRYKVKNDETHPPDEAFKSLDRADHLPQGLLYYKTHDGYSNQINIQSKTHWTTYAGYVALALFVVGLAIITGGAALGAAGAGALAGKFFLGAGLIGAVGASGSIIDKTQRGSATFKSMTVDILDIAGALIGLTKFLAGAKWLRSINAAQQMGFKALNSRYAYLALETLDVGVDTTMVLIGTHDGLKQIMSVLQGPGTIGQKMSDLKFLLPMVAMQYGIFTVSMPNRVLGAIDVHKKKIIDGLPKPKGSNLPNQPKGKTGNTTTNNSQPTDQIDPKKYPALSELRSSEAIFSKTTIDLVMGLMGDPQLLEPIAKAIRKMDQAHLKALCARFYEKDVLYALYYFNGDFKKAANHLGKHSLTFKDHGAKIYDVVYKYESTKALLKAYDNPQLLATKKKDAQSALKMVSDYRKKYEKAQAAEAKQWDAAQQKLQDLKTQQQTTKAQLDALPKKLKETEQALASNEAQAESFGKLTKDKKNIDELGIEAWQKTQDTKLKQANEALETLRKKQKDLSDELTQKQSKFLAEQRKELSEFLSADSKARMKALKDGTLDQYDKVSLKRYDDLQKRQAQEQEKFYKAQDQRREQLRNTREQTNRQEAKVRLEGKQSQLYADAAAVLKKGIALRKQIKQLHDDRRKLFTELHKTQKEIERLQLDLVARRGGRAHLERQIREQNATKNQHEADIVQKDVEIAQLEKQLAELAYQEKRYNLDIRDKLYAHELNEARIKELLQQNVAPKDLDQLKEFVRVQTEQVQTRAKASKEAEQVRDAKQAEAKGLDKKVKDLLDEQQKLEKIRPQLAPHKPLPRGKAGQKKKRRKGNPRKEQSKEARKANVDKRLAAIPAELAQTQDNLRRANNARDSAKAKVSEAESKHRQEQARLEVYEEFQKLQKNIVANKKQLGNERATFDQLRKKLEQTNKDLQDTDTEIKDFRAPLKKNFDIQVTELKNLESTAQKRYNKYSQTEKERQALAQEHQQAKVAYDQVQSYSKTLEESAVTKAARANKLAKILGLVKKGVKMVWQSLPNAPKAKAGAKAVTTGAKPPVLKAWWKVAKISKKLLNIHDKNEALHQAQAYALLECTQLEALLQKCMPNPNDSLSGDEAQLWRLLISTLENTGGHSYRSRDWGNLQKALKDIYDANDKLEAMDAEVLKANRYLAALKAQKNSVYMPTLETKTDEEVKALLEWIKKQKYKKE